MLVLSRRKQQKIVIGDDIVITVLELDRSGQVRIGIEAPRKYRVLRYELYEQVEAENQQARSSLSDPARLAELELPDFPARPKDP